MNFGTWGPFEYDGNIRSFCAQVEEQAARFELAPGELRRAIGCYLFAIKRGDNYKPWYVGKTLAQAGFEGEIFQRHKLEHYKRVLDQTGRKSAHIFLFALVTTESRISRATASSAPIVNWLEKTMIGMALAKNPELCNIRDTKYLREIWVEGLLGKQNPGRAYNSVIEARKALL